MRLNHRNWSRALVMAAMIFAAGCRETALDIQESGVNEFRFYPALDGSIASKAIGDAGSIDQLRIGVYTENTQGLSCTDIVTKTWSEVQQEGVVFAGLRRCMIQHPLHTWVKAAGIRKHITLHCFRHTFATLQIALGTDIYTVSKMLTHKSVSTTQIYADLVNSKKRESANRISLK